jgi:hypothetical protein
MSRCVAREQADTDNAVVADVVDQAELGYGRRKSRFEVGRRVKDGMRDFSSRATGTRTWLVSRGLQVCCGPSPSSGRKPARGMSQVGGFAGGRLAHQDGGTGGAVAQTGALRTCVNPPR